MARPKQSASLVGTTLADRYRVVRQIGRGAMGRVYEAQHAAIGRRLAIKVLNREYGTAAARERFFHEARAAGAISHQHIVPVLDFGLVESGEPYIVMEYVDGQTLEEHLQQRGPLPVEDAVEICAQLLSALEVIHGAGLVHRDVKPANIMLVNVRRPRHLCQLLDFGVSRAMHAAWRRPDLTRVHEVLGTPAYFSPEQAGGGQVDPRWDLWAVGAILYELLTGTLPFKLNSVDQVLSDLVNRRLVPLRRRNGELPEWIYGVVDRVQHEDPERRFATATLFLQALEQATPFPEGEGGLDAKTTPFVRVELETPPPELIGRLSGKQPPGPSGPRGREQAPEPRGRQQAPEPRGTEQAQEPPGDAAALLAAVAGELEAQGLGEEDRTVPMPRLSSEELEGGLDEEERPLPRARPGDTDPVPRPGARPPRRGLRPWLMVVLALLILAAAGSIVYFGLLLR